MLNIFYNPIYFKKSQKKIILTKSFRYSIFFNFLINFLYIFNIPYRDSIVFSGPQMRINHLIKTFRNKDCISFNKNIYENNYIVQFDEFGKRTLDSIIKKRTPKTKVLVGPLYSLKWDQELNKYLEKYSFIKKIVASENSINTQIAFFGESYIEKTIVCPSGVVDEKDLIVNSENEGKKLDCLIYYKNRKETELSFICNYLEKNNLTFKIFEYGSYMQKELIESAENSRFCIILAKTESQGFAIQSLMSKNLPLLVWDYQVNQYEGKKIKGTTVPWWDDNVCGSKFLHEDEFDEVYLNFISNLDNFSPIRFISEHLTYQKFEKNIFNIFNNSLLWSNQNK
jgi:hypothetical protein